MPASPCPVRRPGAIRHAARVHDLELVGVGHARRGGHRLVFELQAQHVFLLAAEQRQDAVRRQLGEGFGIVEIVGEFRAGFGLAVAHLRHKAALRPQRLAQGADEIGVLAEALDQNRAGAIERGGNIGDLLVGIDVGRCGRLRIGLRLRQEEGG